MGQVASTAGQPNPTVVLTAWRADWDYTSVPAPFVVVPGELPDLHAVFTLVGGDTGGITPAIASNLTCLTLLIPAAATPPAIARSFDFASPRDVLSSTPASVTALNASAASIVVAGVSASDAQLGQALTLYTECTWESTGERVRLPPIPLSTLRLALEWAQPPSTILGYVPLTRHMTVTMLTPATMIRGAASVATGRCEMALVNATSNSAVLLADSWSVDINAMAPVGAVVATAPSIELRAPQATIVFIRATCTIWGQSLTSPPLRLTTATLAIQQVSAPPTSFIASDASSSWPVEPQLEVAVAVIDAAGASTMNATDITCSLSTQADGVDLKVVGSSMSSALLSIPAVAGTGTVLVPSFYVQTATTTPSVVLILECRRTSGDTPAPLFLTIPAVRLTAQLCTTPARDSFVGTSLRQFDVGIVAASPGGRRPTAPCANSTSPPSLTLMLPPVVCSIALNASTTTTNDTANIFLQHTVAAMSSVWHRAEFDVFTLVAPQGQTYGLSITCAVGGLVIQPILPFTVTLAGCSPGQESRGVTCTTCGGTDFSLGGVGAYCTGCPPVGAVCNAGIISLLPHYFRPASQAGQPLGPDTELHPCYNSEACTLTYGSSGGTGNVSSGGAVYGCAYGYTGPLCGVCDAAVNYARFGELCSVCWDAGAAWLFLVLVVTIVLAVLTRVALRKDSGRSDASIVLRITLGFLQAVGSLRVFRAGSTKAYDSVMGWTEVVSASPLSVGAFQCILRLPYLAQYAATILLPVAASAAVVVIFHGVTTGRSVHCAPRCRFDKEAFRSAVASWWATKRHLSTLLFVLFLTYMPIVSASLRALDCIEPVAGVRYLRSDLRVECGVGQHAAARALAYTVLVVLGAGFPAGLAWLLGTARNDQLADDGFRATWGFLFDGYRAPTRTLAPPPPLPPASGGSKHSGIRKLLGTRESFMAAAGGVPPGASGRRRATLVPERMTQTWVLSGDSRVWWEAIVLCRKAGVVLLAVTVTNPYLQCVGATLWFAASAVLQARYAPYTKLLFNRLEMVSLTATYLTAVLSTALLQYNVGVTSAELHSPGAMTGIEWTVTVALTVLNVGTFVLLAGLWLHLQCARARGMLDRTTLVSALSGQVAGLRSSSRGTPANSPLQSIPDCADDDAKSAEVGSTVNPLRAGTRPSAAVGSVAPAALSRLRVAPPKLRAAGARPVPAATPAVGVEAVEGDVVPVAPAAGDARARTGSPDAGTTPFVPVGHAAHPVAFTATPVGRRR